MRLRTRLVLTLVAVSIPLAAGGQLLRGDIERRAAVTSLADFARGRMETGGREQCEASPETFRDPPRGPPHGPPHGDGRRGEPPTRERGGPTLGDAREHLDQELPPSGDTLSSETPSHDMPSGDAPSRDTSPRDMPQRDMPPRDMPHGPPRDGPGPGPRVEMFAYTLDYVSDNPDAPAFPADLRRALEGGAREAGDLHDTGNRREVTAAVRMKWAVGPCAIMLAWRHADKPALLALDEIGFAALMTLGLVIAVFVAVGPVERRMRKLTEGVELSAAEHYQRTVEVGGRDEIGDLARAFNAAGSEVRAYIEELEKRERSLRDFVQNTTHDVMLPLTVLQGHLTEVRDVLEAGGIPDRETVREALEESHYMVSLVQNLVAAARLEAGRPTPRRDPFSWNQLVERVVQRHGPIARAKNVELDFAAPEQDVRAEGDVTLVEQALSNVVHNAVRYNRPGGHVAVLLDAIEGRFSVRVFDDGPGVAELELPKLAERTFRSDAARVRDPEGSGLGLSIAQDVAERHGFTLELRQAEAGGLEVEIRGPLLAT